MTLAKRFFALLMTTLHMFGAVAISAVPVHARAASAPAISPWSGEPAPALTLKDIGGAAHDLGQYRGSVVLVNFWATWCVPCREEMPSIQRLRERFAKERFVVLTVNVDEPEARIRNFLTETRLDLPVLVDRNKTATRAWGVRVMPTTILVGPDGRMRYRALGDLDWNNETAAGIVTQLMRGG